MKGMVDQKEMGFAPPLHPSDIMLAISLDPTGRKLTEYEISCHIVENSSNLHRSGWRLSNNILKLIFQYN